MQYLKESNYMKLSVVVPVYNEEKYIDECISSILLQTKKDIEVIIVDDGSTDTSGEKCDLWMEKDNRVRVIHKEHEGTLIARINGICASTYNYITFIDADDFIDSRSFEYAEEYMGNQIDMICFGISRYYDENNSAKEYCSYDAGIYRQQEINDKIFPTMIWDEQKGKPGMDPSLCVKIIKKELIKSLLIGIRNIDLDIGDDILLAYPTILHAKSLVIVDKIYYHHRKRDMGSIAPYYLKEDYFDRVYNLYSALHYYFSKDCNMLKQVEELYISLIQERQIAMNKSGGFIRYLFPFNLIEKGKSIVLYGAGKVGNDYYKQLMQLSYCKKIMWVDKDYYINPNDKVCNPENIFDEDVDYLIIAVLSKNIQKKIAEELVFKGFPKEKIVMV